MRRDGLRTARWIALLLPLALLAGAWGSQLIGGLYPCEMCHWQRWPHYAAVVAAGLAFFVGHRPSRMLLVLFAGVLIALSGAIGLFHAGVEYHWWQGITACAGTVKAADPMAMLEAAMKAPIVMCDMAQWTLLGISLAGYNALLSFAGAVAIFAFAARRQA